MEKQKDYSIVCVNWLWLLRGSKMVATQLDQGGYVFRMELKQFSGGLLCNSEFSDKSLKKLQQPKQAVL